MLVKWSLSESNSYDSEGTFSVYFGFGEFDILAGTTKDHFFEILGLVSHVKFNVRVELKYPYSGLIISATTHHLLVVTTGTNPTDLGRLGNSDIKPTSPSTTTEATTNSKPTLSYTMYAFIAVVVILVAILLLVLFICVFIVCAMKRNRKNIVNSPSHRFQLPQVHANEIYQQVDTINTLAHNNTAFRDMGSVEVPKKTEIELELKLPIPGDLNSIANNYCFEN